MKSDRPHIAIFVATSGHSGVDRLVRHLVPAIARRDFIVDVLKVRKHGPYFDDIVDGMNTVDMGTSHVYSSLSAVIRYIKDTRPVVMLSDKDRVNRTALLARALARVRTRLVLSSGTTISIDLANRGLFERWLQLFSMRYFYPFADHIIVTSKGVGEQKRKLLPLARKLGINEDVNLPGFKHNVYSYMTHASLVSTDCPSGPREILAAGQYGPLVPVGNAEALANAIEKTLDHPLPPKILKEAALPFEIERNTSAYLRAMGLEQH